MKLIGITQRVEKSPRAERRDVLDQAWSRLLIPLGILPVPLPNLAEPDTDIVSKFKLEGIILSGGNDLASLPNAKNTAPERDRFEHKLLEVCRKEKIPVLGVCRGLQLITAHYGGKISPIEGHTAVMHDIKVRSNEIMPFSKRTNVNSYHNFGVKKNDVGMNLIITAVSVDGIVEALAHKKFPQIAIMWHPERMDPFDTQDIELIKEFFK